MGLTQKGAELIKSYEQQARANLAHFDRELLKVDGRRFYIVTKIHQGKMFEQIYVEVESKKSDHYVGKIASDPAGPIKFQRNTPISVAIKDVADWLILSKNGEEEGNLTGKALDALQVGILTFVISMQPKQGVFAAFKVVSVRNPKTQQEVGEIVPEKISSKVEKEAAKRFGNQRAVDEKIKYQFILVSFPDWRLIKD